MANVILAGHNGDVSALRSAEPFTPETIAAAYARISRSWKSATQLRSEAKTQVDEARKSNCRIVYEYGHSSISEHAVFNFDILDCSRLVIEALERHRLCSYTEKSQRYTSITGGSCVYPSEFGDGDVRLFGDVVRAQQDAYHSMRHAIPIEDARYALPLATTGQLGFSCNARNLGVVIQDLLGSPLSEARDLGRQLDTLAYAVAPSLVRRRKQPDPLPDFSEIQVLRSPDVETSVQLLGCSHNPDVEIIGALLFSAGRGPLEACMWHAESMGPQARADLTRKFLSTHEPSRAFEEASFRFELIVDASVFAQLKRHRMCTQHWGPYDPDLGVTIPPSVVEAGERDSYLTLMDRTTEAWRKLHLSLLASDAPPQAADYVLTNAHRRRVSLTINMRSLHHFARLRVSPHAQWAIRDIAKQMVEIVKKVAPATAPEATC